MRLLAEQIETTHAPAGSVALWWLGQAGFAFKSPDGARIYLDAYLSDVVEARFGFKRLSLAPIAPEAVRADAWISTHEHLDHLDIDAIPVVARNNPACVFAGSVGCVPDWEQCGVVSEQRRVLEPAGCWTMRDVTVHAARADHGELSPSALSLLFDFSGVRVLCTGDTALRPEWMQPLIAMGPDVLLPCINGAYGNLNAREAATLTARVAPRVVVPCHFWMFKEHNGDPQAFVEACGALCPSVPIVLPTPGQGVIVTPDSIHPMA